jgi:hypothetical protein
MFYYIDMFLYIIFTIITLSYPTAADDLVIPPANTWTGYEVLSSCNKWCYTACKEGKNTTTPFSTTKSSPSPTSANQSATPVVYISGADLKAYGGLINQLQCSSAECICLLERWLTSFQTVYDCGRQYCQMRLGTTSLPDEDFTKSLGMLATLCTERKFPLPEWILNIRKTYGPNITSPNKE